jgi:hypothetical protein
MSGEDSSPTKRSWKSAGRMSNRFEDLRQPEEDIFACVLRLSQSRILVEYKSLYVDLMQLPNSEFKQAAVLQYEVAVSQDNRRWINNFRCSCQYDVPNEWIDEHLPAPDDRKLQNQQMSAKLYVAVTSRDVRLRDDPTIPVVREEVNMNEESSQASNLSPVSSSVTQPADVVSRPKERKRSRSEYRQSPRSRDEHRDRSSHEHRERPRARDDHRDGSSHGYRERSRSRDEHRDGSRYGHRERPRSRDNRYMRLRPEDRARS